jgi:hypothetical protein
MKQMKVTPRYISEYKKGMRLSYRSKLCRGEEIDKKMVDLFCVSLCYVF